MLNGACHCGRLKWTLGGNPGSITACNCTLCSRYGALWAYDFENEGIQLWGAHAAYRQNGKEDPTLEILFCPICAGVAAWRGLQTGPDGRRRMAVNVRMASADAVADLTIVHFDGLNAFEDLPGDGKCVRDLWF